MTDLPGWAPPGVDTQRANTARVYDYLLGGSHNFLADQDAGRAITALDPAARVFARANRAFLGRAVRFLAANGITQFLDIGSGIPTGRNVHEVARLAAPGARVAYVDVDPVAIAHSKAILAGQPDTAVFEADLRDPEKIVASPEVGRVIDFSQPAGLLLVAVLHFVANAEDPWRLVGTLREALAPGSYLVLGQATSDGRTARNEAFEKMYNRSVATIRQGLAASLMKGSTETSSSPAGWLKSISRRVPEWARISSGWRRSASMIAVFSFPARRALLCAMATGSTST